MKINENIAYAKSILNKNGISNDSEEYKDYLKIREICGPNNGYVGILTKIRFVDKVSDMDEIESIFNVLKSSKIDINKLNKLTYEDILEMFYEELTDKVDKSDIELYYKDDQYSYYRQTVKVIRIKELYFVGMIVMVMLFNRELIQKMLTN